MGSLGASLTPEDFIPSKQENTLDEDSVAVSPDSSMSLDVALEGEEGPEPLKIEGGLGAPVPSPPSVVPRSAEGWNEV